jgi:hypothetical protein
MRQFRIIDCLGATLGFIKANSATEALEINKKGFGFRVLNGDFFAIELKDFDTFKNNINNQK